MHFHDGRIIALASSPPLRILNFCTVLIVAMYSRRLHDRDTSILAILGDRAFPSLVNFEISILLCFVTKLAIHSALIFFAAQDFDASSLTTLPFAAATLFEIMYLLFASKR